MTTRVADDKPYRFNRFGVGGASVGAAVAAFVLLLLAPPAEAGRGADRGSSGTAPRRGSVTIRVPGPRPPSHGSYRGGSWRGSRHGHRGGRHSGTYGRSRWGYWGSSWYGWGWPTTVIVTGSHGRHGIGRWAAVDTDVSPEEAEIWLDGVFVGTADDFDGHPDFLYLRPGSYTLELKLKGYKPVSKTLEVRAGRLVRMNDELERAPGGSKWDSFRSESKRGTPLGRHFGPKATPERPDARDADDDDEIDVEDDSDADVEVRSDRDRTGRWDDDSAPRGKVEARIDEKGRPTAAGPEKADGTAALSGFRFVVTPSDAGVYLDDRYVGTGAELRRRDRPFDVEPGKRVVVVQRPGYQTKKVVVEAKPGAPADVFVELEKD